MVLLVKKEAFHSPSAAPRSNIELICISKCVVKLLAKVTVVAVGFQQLPVRLDPSIHRFCNLIRAVTSAVGLTEVKTPKCILMQPIHTVYMYMTMQCDR